MIFGCTLDGNVDKINIYGVHFIANHKAVKVKENHKADKNDAQTIGQVYRENLASLKNN